MSVYLKTLASKTIHAAYRFQLDCKLSMLKSLESRTLATRRGLQVWRPAGMKVRTVGGKQATSHRCSGGWSTCLSVSPPLPIARAAITTAAVAASISLLSPNFPRHYVLELLRARTDQRAGGRANGRGSLNQKSPEKEGGGEWRASEREESVPFQPAVSLRCSPFSPFFPSFPSSPAEYK